MGTGGFRREIKQDGHVGDETAWSWSWPASIWSGVQFRRLSLRTANPWRFGAVKWERNTIFPAHARIHTRSGLSVRWRFGSSARR